MLKWQASALTRHRCPDNVKKTLVLEQYECSNIQFWKALPKLHEPILLHRQVLYGSICKYEPSLVCMTQELIISRLSLQIPITLPVTHSPFLVAFLHTTHSPTSKVILCISNLSRLLQLISISFSRYIPNEWQQGKKWQQNSRDMTTMRCRLLLVTTCFYQAPARARSC